MRAGVLSKDEIIEFLNERFISTWVPNSELGRIRSLRKPIAKRREREAKTFDTTHPLAQAIIKGWKAGAKKRSPVDCFFFCDGFCEFSVLYRIFCASTEFHLRAEANVRNSVVFAFFFPINIKVQSAFRNVHLKEGN